MEFEEVRGNYVICDEEVSFVDISSLFEVILQYLVFYRNIEEF